MCIGSDAGFNGCAARTIIINSSGLDLSPTTTDAFFVKPIQSTNSANYLTYNSTTGEITYGNSTSDDRLKHDERNITNGLEIIRQLEPQFYKKTHNIYETDISGTQLIPKLDASGNKIFFDASYNGDIGIEGLQWNYSAGLIAQDVKLINDLSFVVSGGNNRYDNSNNLIDICPMGLNYESVFTYNIAATKELDAIVETQRQEIAELKQEIAELKQNNSTLRSSINIILGNLGLNQINW